MPDFWQFPTVSMGLGPIMAIYQARFNRYLEDRGLKPKTDAKVWAFLGDGETDEPESLGAITLASREKLDNLIFVVNCNLQRLDGPVRGNGKIIQELESDFRGAGWNVIKVIWGRERDALLEKDTEGCSSKRNGEIVDGEYPSTRSRRRLRREAFLGAHPRLRDGQAPSDEQLKNPLGGHDPGKFYNAYKRATEPRACRRGPRPHHQGLRRWRVGEGKNITHHKEAERRRVRRSAHPFRDSDLG